MFQISNLEEKITDSISKNRANWKSRKFVSSIVVVILLSVMTMDGFSQELERVQCSNNGVSGYWKFVDKSTRETIIPCEYLSAKDFSEGLAAVLPPQDYYYWGFIDKTGEVVIPFYFQQAESFSEGFAAVKLKGKWGFIDKTGKEVIPFIYDDKATAKVELERKKIELEREKVLKEPERTVTQEREILVSQTINPIKTNAYDIILLKSGNEIKAKVFEITDQLIKYKDFDFLSGPTRNLNISEVFMITYENGKKEVFNKLSDRNISPSKRQNFTNCAKNTAFGLDIGIGGGKESDVFSSALGIRVMHHFNPYFGIDFVKVNWITDVVAQGYPQGLWTMKLQLMPGARGNSPTFFKCMSVYGAFRLGYGMHIATGYSGGLLKGATDFKGLCLETELGINLTPTIFVGFSYNYHNGFGNYFKSSPWQHTFSTRFGFNFGK